MTYQIDNEIPFDLDKFHKAIKPWVVIQRKIDNCYCTESLFEIERVHIKEDCIELYSEKRKKKDDPYSLTIRISDIESFLDCDRILMGEFAIQLCDEVEDISGTYWSAKWKVYRLINGKKYNNNIFSSDLICVDNDSISHIELTSFEDIYVEGEIYESYYQSYVNEFIKKHFSEEFNIIKRKK